jgi:hypothetical protein
MKFPVPVQGSRITTLGRGQRVSELLLQRLLHGIAHVVDDFARRVHDAVRIGDIGGEALEELLIDGIQKILLLSEVAEVRALALDAL